MDSRVELGANIITTGFIVSLLLLILNRAEIYLFGPSVSALMIPVPLMLTLLIAYRLAKTIGDDDV